VEEEGTRGSKKYILAKINKQNITIILVKNKTNSVKEDLMMDISLKLIIRQQIIQS
jgi:ribonucleotide monophosphatase NagD (HAD superfamily)